MNKGVVSIPDWGSNGLLPANDVDNPTSRDRSPYNVSLNNFIAHFGNTEPRRQLLRGLLDFRAQLQGAGIVTGFQWVDGSFTEHIEKSKNRLPDDIDIVTFFHLPSGYTANALRQKFPSLFEWHNIKTNYSIDAYFVQLDEVFPEEVIRESSYWHSVWAHTRDGQWKGFLQIDLADNDKLARSQLDQLNDDEGGKK